MAIWNKNKDSAEDGADVIEVVMGDVEAGKKADEYKETASEAPYVYLPGTEEERALVRKIDMRLFPMLWVMFCMNYLDRTNIGVSVRLGLADGRTQRSAAWRTTCSSARASTRSSCPSSSSATSSGRCRAT
jgi:hypothetical protein